MRCTWLCSGTKISGMDVTWLSGEISVANGTSGNSGPTSGGSASSELLLSTEMFFEESSIFEFDSSEDDFKLFLTSTSSFTIVCRFPIGELAEKRLIAFVDKGLLCGRRVGRKRRMV